MRMAVGPDRASNGIEERIHGRGGRSIAGRTMQGDNTKPPGEGRPREGLRMRKPD
jgi:hypothetical protein